MPAGGGQDDAGAPPTLKRILLPTIVTMLSLCCGISAIKLGFEGSFETAVVFIFIAALLDGIDGRIARLIGGASRFGAELDSLADLVNFGVAPAVVLYLWGLEPMGYPGWAIAVGFALCMALRLARFNAAIDGPARPKWTANYFQGVPAPAAAFLLLMPYYASHIEALHMLAAGPFVPVYSVVLAGLTISKLPTFSGKLIGRRITRAMLLPPIVAGLGTGAALLAYPWHVVIALCLGYFALLPVSSLRHRVLRGRTRAAGRLDGGTA